jgi:hypothetical protein
VKKRTVIEKDDVAPARRLCQTQMDFIHWKLLEWEMTFRYVVDMTTWKYFLDILCTYEWRHREKEVVSYLEHIEKLN